MEEEEVSMLSMLVFSCDIVTTSFPVAAISNILSIYVYSMRLASTPQL